MIGVINLIHWHFYLFLSAIRLFPPDAPQVTIIGYDNNWYLGRTNVVLTCQATGNPVPLSVLWKTWVSTHQISFMFYLLLSLFQCPLLCLSLFFSYSFCPYQSQVHGAVIRAFISATTALCCDCRDSCIMDGINGSCDSRFNLCIMRNTIRFHLLLFPILSAINITVTQFTENISLEL